MNNKLIVIFWALSFGLIALFPVNLFAFSEIIPYPAPLVVSYGPDPLQKIDIYRDVTLASQPVALIIHGGSWQTGDKSAVSLSLEFQTKLLYQRGYAIVSMNYRLAPQSLFPSAVDDVRSVVDWIVTQGPAYGLQSEIIIDSESAGSNIGAIVAVTDSRIRGIITVGLPSKLDDFADDSFTGTAAGVYFGSGCKISTCLLKAGQSSPYWIATRSVPMLMIHGELDTIVPYSQSNIMATKNGSTLSAVIIVPGAGHVGAELNTPSVENAISYFADNIIPNRKVNNSQFISQTVPTTMIVGTTYPVTITFKNNGTTTWVPKNIIGEYVLGSENPQGNSTWGMGRVALPVFVEAGQQSTFSFNVTAPSTPGTYNFQWKMIQELVQWFGAVSTNVAVTVTSNPTTDTTPPTVNMTAPTNGSTVSGSSVTVSANATDNVAVASVQFQLDGVNLGTLDTTSPYSVTWDTTTASNGTHTLTAIAKDAANNTTTSSSVSVTVSNIITFQRTIQLDPEGRTSKIISSTLYVLDTSKTLIKSYPFTTNSSGQVTITFDIPPQVVYLKLNPIPFLTKLLPLDLNTTTTYTFPKLLNGDIDNNNLINSLDYSALNIKWFTSDAASDLNKDGLVNVIDFSYINLHWMSGGDT